MTKEMLSGGRTSKDKKGDILIKRVKEGVYNYVLWDKSSEKREGHVKYSGSVAFNQPELPENLEGVNSAVEFFSLIDMLTIIELMERLGIGEKIVKEE